jgi:hypothetical protein
MANWKPIAVYGLAVLAFGAVLPVLAAQVLIALFPAQAAVTVVQVFLAAWGLMLAATLHISDYVSYRDVFHFGETLSPPSAVSADAQR